MQCGEGADEANCDDGGCGYVVSIDNDGGGGKEKNHHKKNYKYQKYHHKTYSWINYSFRILQNP